MLLAGDVGATKTLLGLFAPAPGRPRAVAVRSVTTAGYTGLEAVVHEFLAREDAQHLEIAAASFGVAGPIVNQVAELTNVRWHVDAAAVARRFAFPRVTLLNDLEAMAYAVPALDAGELAVLQEGRRGARGNAALIAAGTGLGEALLHEIDGRLVPSPTEGGHADFAPRTTQEAALLDQLTRLHGRVDYERVLSGPGLVNIHRFLHPQGCAACDPSADPSAAPSMISESALEGRCPLCVSALRMFVSIYGAEAGNLALRSVATRGLFVGGGIAPKILPALEAGPFMEAFRAKSPMADFMADLPVAVILNDQAGLIGAAVHANGVAA